MSSSSGLHPTAERMYRFIIRFKRMNGGDSPSRREIAAGVWAVDRRSAIKVFWAFVFSGTPMIVGDLERYLERVRNGDSALAYLAARHGKGCDGERGISCGG